MATLTPALRAQIQNLEDSELIRIFLEIVQRSGHSYEKTSKEISYKCHEASWILGNLKATGYGRSESEAYKHALRNLLEAGSDEACYRSYFIELLRPTRKETFKTEAESPEHTRNYATYSKAHQMSTKNHPFPEPTPQHRLVQPRKDHSVHHSKITLNQDSNDQITQARLKIKSLHLLLQKILLENESLKEQIIKKNGDKNNKSVLRTDHSVEKSFDKSVSNAFGGISPLNKSVSVLHPHKIHTLHTVQSHNAAQFAANPSYFAANSVLKDKINIPKLKLDILPNYHKKAEKSLNESLMAAYQQKHEKKML